MQIVEQNMQTLVEKKIIYKFIQTGARVSNVSSGESLKSIHDLLTEVSTPISGFTFHVLSFYDDLSLGGGVFTFDFNADKSTANGGTIIDPDSIGTWDGTQSQLRSQYYGTSGQGTGVGFGCWVRINIDEKISPEIFGTVGDGVADDTTAISSAIAAAGVNGVLSFSPNKTYLISNTIVELSGQIWQGNGSTIKRDDEIVTTITEPLTAGQFPGTFGVVSTAGFYVGQSVTFASSTIPGDRAGSAGELKYWEIIAIGVGTITLSEDPGFLLIKSYVAGDYFLNTGHMVLAGGSGASNNQLFNFTLDGNKDNNITWPRWELTDTVHIVSDGGRIEKCNFINAAAEAILATGDNLIITSNSIVDSGGNGIHLGATVDALISDNTIDNCNIVGENTGHSDGAVVASNEVRKTLIVNNRIMNTNGYPAVGAFQDEQNSDVQIIGNHIEDTIVDGVASRPCIEVRTAADFNKALIISNNTIINGGSIYAFSIAHVSGVSGVTAGTFGPIISNNYFEKTGVFIGSLNAVIEGNTFLNMPDLVAASILPASCLIAVDTPATKCLITNNTFLETAGESRPCIYVTGKAYGSVISKNIFTGYSTAIQGNNAGLDVLDHVTISDNEFYNQLVQNIFFSITGATTVGDQNRVLNNRFFDDGNGLSALFAINNFSRDSICSGNFFEITTQPSGNFICIRTDSDGGGSIINSNTFKFVKVGTAEPYAIHIYNALDFVEYNYGTDYSPTGGTFRDLSGGPATLTNNRLMVP